MLCKAQALVSELMEMFYQTITTEETIGILSVREMTVEKIRVEIAVENAKKSTQNLHHSQRERLRREQQASSRQLEQPIVPARLLPAQPYPNRAPGER